MNVDFLGPAYKSQSLPLSCQTVVNLVFEPAAPGQQGGMLIERPGLVSWLTIGSGPLRGGRVLKGYGWVVSGNTLYRVATDGTLTSIGTVPGSGWVSIEENETQIVVAHSAGWHVHNPVSMTWNSVPDSPTTAQTTYMAGRVYFPLENGTYGWTELNTASSIDALNFASAEFRPDPTRAVWSDNGQLLIFGDRTLEFAQLTADPEAPVVRSSVVEFGISAIRSIAADDNSVFFLGQNENGDPRVYRIQGFSPVGISDFAIDQALNSYGDLSGAYGFCWAMDGHAYYLLTVPGYASWVYDISTQRWQQFAYRNPLSGELEAYLGLFHLKLGASHYVGSRSDATVYRMDKSAHNDGADPIYVERTIVPVENGGKNVAHDRFELFAEMGVGLDGGMFGSDPKVVLTWSDDRGRSFTGYAELPLGKIGEYNKRAVKHRLGMSRHRVYRIYCSDPVKRVFYGADLELRPLAR